MVFQWSQIFKVTFVFLLSAFVVYLLAPFWLPLTLGGIFSIIALPVYKKLLRFKFHKTLASFTTIFLFFLIVLTPTTILIHKGATSSKKFFSKINQDQDISQKLTEKQQENMRRLNDLTVHISESTGLELPSAQEIVNQSVVWVSTHISIMLKNFFAKIPDIALAFIIAIITMYFGLTENEKIKTLVIKHSQLTPQNAEKLSQIIIGACKSVVLANVATSATQAFLIALMASLSGFGHFFTIGFITFLMSFIPVIGTASVTLSLATYGFFTDQLGAGIAMLLVAAVAGILDNIIRPVLLSESAEMHPLLGLLAILGGVATFGLVGLIFGPLLVVLALNCIPLFLDDYQKSRIQ